MKAKKLGIRLLIYYNDANILPVTIGNKGPIIELECNHEQHNIKLIGENVNDSIGELSYYDFT